MRIKQTEEFKQEVISLRKQNISYGEIAKLKGISRSSVQTICTNSGLFSHNKSHDEFFAYKAVGGTSTEVSTLTLPTPRNTTGDSLLNAYEWIIDIVNIGTPQSSAKAIELIEKLSNTNGVTEGEIINKYHKYTCDRDGVSGFVCIFTKPDEIRVAVKQAEKKREARNTCTLLFGSEDGVFNMLPPERLLYNNTNASYERLKNDGYKTKGIRGEDGFLGWEEFYSQFYTETREEINRGIPEPHTIEQVFIELEYWGSLIELRRLAKKKDSKSHDDPVHIYAREHHLKVLLEKIKPRNREERLQIIKWVISDDQVNYINYNKEILMNAIN